MFPGFKFVTFPLHLVDTASTPWASGKHVIWFWWKMNHLIMQKGKIECFRCEKEVFWRYKYLQTLLFTVNHKCSLPALEYHLYPSALSGYTHIQTHAHTGAHSQLSSLSECFSRLLASRWRPKPNSKCTAFHLGLKYDSSSPHEGGQQCSNDSAL